jgi:hypothetical protein
MVKKLVAVMMVAMMVASVASAEWRYGIGTGLFKLNVEGDQGLATRIAGPVELGVDLDPDDVKDLMETAIGFGGYATDGQWMIKYSYGQLELVDEPSATLPSGATVDSELSFEVKTADLSVGYVVHQDENMVVTPYVGLRYIKHDLSADLDVTTAAGTTSVDRGVDHDWTDARIGVAVDVPVAEGWIWGSTAEAAFGGSDGSYRLNTGVLYMFAEQWAARLYGDFHAIDFENGSRGDSDWYLYDADEFGLGLSVLYNW